ncbi:hypothetical protein ACFVT5_26815 [Streptomyces sp. NPDC058001]|uniref:hypothetical protein n=1 Tax=Streptomyces sp. NPDC058001 TaxID=3346300 RepID=UPI0036E5A660
MNLRLVTLMGVVTLTVLLPFAGASAGPLGAAGNSGRDSGRDGGGSAGRSAPRERPESGASGQSGSGSSQPWPSGRQASDARNGSASGPETPRTPSSSPLSSPSSSSRSSSLLTGLGLTSGARCGPELASPDGLEAQTCVLTQGGETWARTYYRNATGAAVSSLLTLMAPGGLTVQTHCTVGTSDDPGACETPRGRTRGSAEAYTAIAEFAAPTGSVDGAHGAVSSAESGPLLLRSGSNSAAPEAR